MTTSPSTPQTAMDRLVATNGTIVQPEQLAEAIRAGDFLRKMGLLSTKPTTISTPFSRRTAQTAVPLVFWTTMACPIALREM